MDKLSNFVTFNYLEGNYILHYMLLIIILINSYFEVDMYK